nr:immunoglobulin light chain junction region [Macaca mulatta]MOV76180.1 immunoglobulin light chain junction region [Macaca mulatta]MOV77406.1 immunoglobulin light chain junction region [Macaca mulatta]MOW45207.1 immunoglobulin light chain junction region [Macaca mulatta]
CQQHDNSPLTF